MISKHNRWYLNRIFYQRFKTVGFRPARKIWYTVDSMTHKQVQVAEAYAKLGGVGSQETR